MKKVIAIIILTVFCCPNIGFSQEFFNHSYTVSTVIQIAILLTILSLAPAILIMLTSFTRFIIVFSILRQAMGTQQMPPNQVLIGISLFLTFFVMTPVWQKINQQAFKPYLSHQLSLEAAFVKASIPLREFMLKQTREKDLALFAKLAKITPATPADLPMTIIIPAFVISELKTAFQIGFFIYIPFLVIDMVVASVLLSMGMLMLPPIMISLPFKLMLFVLVDGWGLIVGSLLQSINF
ncbi:MAG TPA: flagellar biosynthesis protein FliP [Candidatus Desulfofervidus auxilii]|uniref:Flagellar biosynthetic protein FliP n=1 Tax=Desulfofervidus auxilii TaxID=1621989 RepID=A0A7C0U3S2_DESA2|nr:flagellar biosynthesis protein FliP [Candidatus Desulfofervidus auxilii]